MQKSRPLTCSVQQMVITGVSDIWLISLVAALIFPDLQASGFFLPRIHSRDPPFYLSWKFSTMVCSFPTALSVAAGGRLSPKW